MLSRTSWLFAVLLVTIPGIAQAQSVCDAITGNLVLNCGFELGTFADWTLGGNPGFDDIAGGSIAHSGKVGAQLGPVGSPDTMTQVITDTAGTVDLAFFLQNEGGPVNNFKVLWNGVAVTTTSTPTVNAGAFPYTGQGPVALTSTGSDTLEFVFQQDPSFWDLDDISVVQLAATPEPGSIFLMFAVLGLCGMALRKSALRNAA